MRIFLKVGIRTVAALAVLFAVRVEATSIIAEDLGTRISHSDLVVRGTVKSVKSRWVGEGSQKLITRQVVIHVAEALKGHPPKDVVLVEPGGQVGDIAQRIDGMAEFSTGEEVVVFLEAKPGGDVYAVRGMAQGKLTVERSSDGKMAFVVPSATGAEVVDPVTGESTTATAKPKELKLFRKQVLAAVKLQSARRGTDAP